MALRKSTARADASTVYQHLASDRDVATARVYRQQVDREIATINRGLSDEDAPRSRVQPRSHDVEQCAANAMYPYLGEQAVRAREQYERWQERMMPRGFTRKRAHSDWWSRRGK
jgi:hypothetical protein